MFEMRTRTNLPRSPEWTNFSGSILPAPFSSHCTTWDICRMYMTWRGFARAIAGWWSERRHQNPVVHLKEEHTRPDWQLAPQVMEPSAPQDIPWIKHVPVFPEHEYLNAQGCDDFIPLLCRICYVRAAAEKYTWCITRRSIEKAGSKRYMSAILIFLSSFGK